MITCKGLLKLIIKGILKLKKGLLKLIRERMNKYIILFTKIF